MLALLLTDLSRGATRELIEQNERKKEKKGPNVSGGGGGKSFGCLKVKAPPAELAKVEALSRAELEGLTHSFLDIADFL